MEAPEKIYVQLPLKSWIGKSWDETPNPNCNATNVEYICKDVVDNMLKTAEDHAYFAGSEAMREKMMEDTIETEVLTAWSDGEANINIPIDAEKGDIIKVIIIKGE